MSTASSVAGPKLSRRGVTSARIRRLLGLQDLPPWLSSLCVHMMALIVLGLVEVSLHTPTPPSSFSITAGDEDGGLGKIDLGTADGDQNGTESIKPDVPDVGAMLTPVEISGTALSPSHMAPELPLDLGSSLKVSNEPPLAASRSGAIGGTGQSVGTGDGSKLGSGSTSFFGLKGTGKKFVYVFDRSDSMNYQYYTEGPVNEFRNIPIQAAKAELLASIYELNRKQQFSIVFYNHMAQLFSLTKSGQPALATPENKRLVRDAISELRGDGGTNHLAALQMAIRMKPDVIFLMTDGEPKDDLSPEDLRRLSEANHSGAVINVIQFAQVSRPESTMVQLAQKNGGRHIFVDVTKVGELARKIKDNKAFEQPETNAAD